MDRSRKSAEYAIDWLLNSAIHNLDKSNTETFGSFNNYYDLRKRKCSYAYTEITAYAIELLLYLYERTNDPRYFKNARLAGEWLGSMQFKGADENAIGGFLQSPNGPMAHRVFSFDSAICISALSDLYRKTGDNKYLKMAGEGARWLIQVMRNSDGSFKPFYDLTTKRFSSKPNSRISFWPIITKLRKTWHELPGCHHGKIAIGLLKYYSIEKNPLLLQIVRTLCYWVLTQQDHKGYFRVNPERKASFSHTHCYATEGLLYASLYLKDKQLFDAGKKASDWLIKIQRYDGSIPSWFDNGKIISSVDSSAVAQAVRLWKILYSETGDQRYFDSIKKGSRYLLSMQRMNSESDMLRGFYLVEFDLKFFRYKLKRLYSWSTIFAIHSLALVNETSKSKILASELW